MAYTPINKRDFYVSSTGNDSSDGQSPTRPWLTIAKVNAYTFQGGDTIHFEGNSSFTGPLNVQSGSAGNPTVYKSYGIGKATIIGNNTGGVHGRDVSHCIVADLVVVGTNQPTTWLNDGIYFDVGYVSVPKTITNIAVINCEVSGFAGMGVTLYSTGTTATASNMLVEGCILHDNMNGLYIWGPDTGSTKVYSNITVRNTKSFNNRGLTGVTYIHTGSGIAMSNVATGLIELCEAFNNGAKNGWTDGGPVGIWVSDCSGITIRKCVSHNNQTGVGTARKDGGGFNIDGGSQNCTIEKCYSYNNAGAGYSFYEYGSPAAAYTGNVIRYNIGIANGKMGSDAELAFWSLEAGFANNRVHNNLFISDGTVTAGAPSVINFVGTTVTLGQLNIFNNIFIADGANSKILNGTVQGTWSNNYFHTLNSANANYSTGGTVGDPLLKAYNKVPPAISIIPGTDFAQYLADYKLLATSGCINTGLGTLAGYTFPTRDFFDNVTPEGTINIGPHELIT